MVSVKFLQVILLFTFTDFASHMRLTLAWNSSGPAAFSY